MAGREFELSRAWNRGSARIGFAGQITVLLVWFGLVSVLILGVMSSHALPLPLPLKQPSSPPMLIADGHWMLEHILSADCECSHRIARRLIERGKLAGIGETVYLIGKDAPLEQNLTAAGYRVALENGESLASRFGIQGAPWLICRNPGGVIVYSGGYAPSRIPKSGSCCDLEILAAARRGQPFKAFPSYGCATSESLRQQLNPLGIHSFPLLKESYHE